MLKCLLPSVSVALLITWVSLVFRLVEVALFLPRLSTRPVPTETTHSSGVLGHKHLDSWIASAVGLLIRRPPSCPRNKREKVFYGKTWGEKKKTTTNCCLKPQKHSWFSTISGWNVSRSSDGTKRRDSRAVAEVLIRFLHSGFDIQHRPGRTWASHLQATQGDGGGTAGCG